MNDTCFLLRRFLIFSDIIDVSIYLLEPLAHYTVLKQNMHSLSKIYHITSLHEVLRI